MTKTTPRKTFTPDYDNDRLSSTSTIACIWCRQQRAAHLGEDEACPTEAHPRPWVLEAPAEGETTWTVQDATGNDVARCGDQRTAERLIEERGRLTGDVCVSCGGGGCEPESDHCFTCGQQKGLWR